MCSAFFEQGLTLEGVRSKLKEFHDAIGDEGGADEADRQRARIMRLLVELGYKEEERPEPGPELPQEDAAVVRLTQGQFLICTRALRWQICKSALGDCLNDVDLN